MNVSSELGLLRQLPETAKRAVTSANSLEELERLSYSDADKGKVPQWTDPDNWAGMLATPSPAVT